MNHIAAAFLSECDQARALLPPGSSDSGGSGLLLPAYQAALMLIAGAFRVGHGVTVAGSAQMNSEGGEEASMPAAPS